MTYYTPTIEEFFPGFEFQEFYAEGWHDRICWKDDFPNILNSDEDTDLSDYRVKYLDTEDIKELGWELAGNSKSPFTDMIYTTFKITKEVGFNTGSDYYLVLTENNRIEITVFEYSSYGGDKGNLFFTVKNKSELRKLMKQLEI